MGTLGVVSKHTVTNHVSETERVLGIEAARCVHDLSLHCCLCTFGQCNRAKLGTERPSNCV